MGTRRHKPEETVTKLRQVEVLVGDDDREQCHGRKPRPAADGRARQLRWMAIPLRSRLAIRPI